MAKDKIPPAAAPDSTPPQGSETPPVAKTYTEAEFLAAQAEAYENGKNDTQDAVDEQLQPVAAALGLGANATTADVVQAIAKLKGNQNIDPVLAKMIEQKMAAGLPRSIAEQSARSQIARDAERAAAKATPKPAPAK